MSRLLAIAALLSLGCTAHRLRAEVLLPSVAARAGDTVAARICNQGPGNGRVDPVEVILEYAHSEGGRRGWVRTQARSPLEATDLAAGECAEARVAVPQEHPYAQARIRVRMRRGDGGFSGAFAPLAVYGEKLPDGRPVAGVVPPPAPGADHPYEAWAELDRRCPGFAGFPSIEGVTHLALTADADEACVRREGLALQNEQRGLALGFAQFPVVRARYRFLQQWEWAPIVTWIGGWWSQSGVGEGFIDLGICDPQDLPKVEQWLGVLPVPRDAVRVRVSCLELVGSSGR